MLLFLKFVFCLLVFFFLTNSECFRSGAFTQRKETGIAVNLSQLLCCPPLHFQKQWEAALAKGASGCSEDPSSLGWSCWPILRNHNNQEWRIILFIPAHSVVSATPSPNNDMVCVARSLHPSPLHSYTTEMLCPRGHRSSHLTVYKGQDAVGR